MDRATGGLWFGALLLAALLSGCALEGGETKTVTVPQAPSSGESKQKTETPAPAPAQPAVAEAETSIDGVRARFKIVELKRSGSTVVLNAEVEPLEEVESAIGGSIADTFSDGQDQRLPSDELEGIDVFDGAALVDSRARKKYLVARDSEGRCVCSNGLNGTYLADGTARLQATLSAPPAGVDRADLTVPRVKTFSDVPISG